MSKYFTYEERLRIQLYLKECRSFREIGKILSKDPSTISREIRKYHTEVATGYPGFPYNACKHRVICRKKKICGDSCSRVSNIMCRLCQKCNDNCNDFLLEVCMGRLRAPYVCNGCELIQKCTLLKSFYDAERAHIKAHRTISEARSGLCVCEEEVARLNALISPLVQKGQSVHQIYISNLNELMCSEKTIYNYIDACILDVRNIDLPRKVKFRQRYKKPEFKVDKRCRISRNYTDFQSFICKNSDSSIVQMDTVIGKVGGKCLLTIHFVETSFMLAFLRDANTSKSVINVFSNLHTRLGDERFKTLFPVILTDNGSEFSNPIALEYDLERKPAMRRTRIYYCDAGSPHQKGAIEVNHSLIRRVLPKSSSFDHLTQEDINQMMSHINSYKRKKLNDRSPYDAFSFYHGEEVLRILECTLIPASDILLKPALLKK